LIAWIWPAPTAAPVRLRLIVVPPVIATALLIAIAVMAPLLIAEGHIWDEVAQEILTRHTRHAPGEHGLGHNL
jgi:hypothetical protein